MYPKRISKSLMIFDKLFHYRNCVSAYWLKRFSAGTVIYSGHNRWSKIRHDKGKADSRRGTSFSKLSNEISAASRDGGRIGEEFSHRLATAVAAAKKAGMSKGKIEAAIDRGQGVSATGVLLEPVTLEVVAPDSSALVIECLTENRLKLLQDAKALLGKQGAQMSPTAYLFRKRGIIRLSMDDYSLDDILGAALDLEGTEDIAEDTSVNPPEVVITTGARELTTVVFGLKETLKLLNVIRSSIEWIPNPETMVTINTTQVDELNSLISRIQDLPDVQAVYTNAQFT